MLNEKGSLTASSLNMLNEIEGLRASSLNMLNEVGSLTASPQNMVNETGSVLLGSLQGTLCVQALAQSCFSVVIRCVCPSQIALNEVRRLTVSNAENICHHIAL